MNISEKLQSSWLKFSIKTDPVLVDALSDFLVGITGAEVEIAVDDNSLHITVNAFIEKQIGDETQSDRILQQISDHMRELAAIFHVSVPQI